MRRWFEAGVFEEIAQDLRLMVRLLEGRDEQQIAVIMDVRTLQSTPESGGRAGYDGAKKKKSQYCGGYTGKSAGGLHHCSQ